MRVVVALLAAIGIAAGARGEPGRKSAAIAVDGVEVRAGGALGFPAVGQLKKDDRVIVVREEDTGFLAILPPAGSVSWMKQIHLGKVEGSDGGRANVPVAVEGAEVLAGSQADHRPTHRVTTRLPKGTIVEVTGPAVRIDNSSWYPITPPEGDLRWIPKGAVTASSLNALAAPPPYARPETPAFTVSGSGSTAPAARPAAASLPTALTDHRLWAQADQAERRGDPSTAKGLYARIYQDLWDQKAERDAIVICYNRYTRCEEAIKRSSGGGPRSESRRAAPPAAEAPGAGGPDRWSEPGYLREMQKVYVDGQPVYSFEDDGGTVTHYVTAVPGISLRNYNGKRVRLYGAVASRPELYKPHMSVERVEAVR